MNWTHVAALMVIVFACNLPLGKWRSVEKRLSLRWFLAVHLSIPLIFFLRLYWQLPIWLIPFSVGIAVFSQFLGGMLWPRWIPLARKRSPS